jgi:hypothetical protein
MTFAETGVGWYPNSTFVHVDVREESVAVDVSSPGERPRYVQKSRATSRRRALRSHRDPARGRARCAGSRFFA